MRSYLLIAVSALVAMAAWAGLVFTGTMNGWTRTALAEPDDVNGFLQAAIEMIDADHRGNLGFALLENGEVVGEHYVSIGAPVDRDTGFQVASLSKWISAVGIMALVEDGRLDLDAPVSTYLQSWQLPGGEFDNDGVTIRRLLSHTAGLTDGLGYGGFAPGHEIQPLTESLTRASDASPGADGRVRVGLEPGEQFEYSGGGYSLLQLLIEDVMGEDFESYMQRTVFQPLGMENSTYLDAVSDNGNRATLYDVDGSEAVRYRFAGLAPTALNSSTADMVRFLQSNLENGTGNTARARILQPQTIGSMREPHASDFGLQIWGLGNILYAPNGHGDFIAGHDGSNDPAINSAVRYNPATGDGIVILETGNRFLATRIAGEWVFWQSHRLDVLSFAGDAGDMILTILAGIVLIGLITIAIAASLVWRRWRRRRRVAAV
ncbi:beta-lactamase family protein [Hyphobacterium sp. CCMP332]|uniref:serine hydrolase domain-containing protein n=1 Tax=Hyphobacterium sp. CCMP332 TaxID=2749086 RepID=UPI00164F0EE5|nr:serine hydrolase domain-containing protein [Hyphobacterium sp. CCMP332]QNL19940.1 beta-lactamase family protein [Hyphobacterium sp. CCMP332]